MLGHYTVHQLAQYLGVSDRTVERWYAAGTIPEPAVVDDNGWKFWSADQGKKMLAWQIQKRSRSARS